MDRIKIPFSELRFSFAKSSGPGGQNANKLNTKVTMTWDPAASTCPESVIERFKQKYPRFVLDDGTIQIVCQVHRSQKANQDECITRLHELLNTVLRPPKVRKATKPKRSAVLDRLKSKKKDGEKKRLRSKNYE